MFQTRNQDIQNVEAWQCKDRSPGFVHKEENYPPGNVYETIGAPSCAFNNIHLLSIFFKVKKLYEARDECEMNWQLLLLQSQLLPQKVYYYYYYLKVYLIFLL